MHPERRCAPRYPVAVEIQVNDGRGMTVNISATGVYFEITDLLQPEQVISVVFPFEHAAPGARAACSGRVLRIDRLPHGYGVAASYEQIAFEVRRL